MDRIKLVSGEEVKARRIEDVKSLDGNKLIAIYRTIRGRMVVCVAEDGEIPYVDPDTTPADYGYMD